MSEQRVRERLAYWGRMQTSELIASFREQGIKGYRSNGQKCPITNALKNSIGAGETVWTGGDGSLRFTDCEGKWIELSLPFSVQHFIRWFDWGELPEFDAELEDDERRPRLSK